MDRSRINNQFNERFNNFQNRPFTNDWWGRNRGRYPSWQPWGSGRYSSGYWYRWCTAPALAGWFTWSSPTPYYYNYGSDGNVYYENNVVYVNGEQYATEQEYYDQAVTLAESVPQYTETQSEEMEWLPLGVWALTKEGVSASNIVVQLAVNQDGVIAGTLYNETSQATHPLEGSVDRDSQRAAWRLADGTNEDFIMETGVYNLTENETMALVHYGAEKTQEVVMVRLDEAESETAEG